MRGARACASIASGSATKEGADDQSAYVRNEAALTQAVDRWNAGDLDGYLRFYDDEIRVHGFAQQPMDKAAVRAFYEGMFTAFAANRPFGRSAAERPL